MVPGVHGQAAGAPAEAVALRPELARVAHLAEQLTLVLRAVGGVQQLGAQTWRGEGVSTVDLLS